MHPVARVSTNTLMSMFCEMISHVFSMCTFYTDSHRSGPKHVVVVHNKIEHEKHLLRTVVLIKVLVKIECIFCDSLQTTSTSY
jgi:hypothetical protein